MYCLSTVFSVLLNFHLKTDSLSADRSLFLSHPAFHVLAAIKRFYSFGSLFDYKIRLRRDVYSKKYFDLSFDARACPQCSILNEVPDSQDQQPHLKSVHALHRKLLWHSRLMFHYRMHTVRTDFRKCVFCHIFVSFPSKSFF